MTIKRTIYNPGGFTRALRVGAAQSVLVEIEAQFPTALEIARKRALEGDAVALLCCILAMAHADGIPGPLLEKRVGPRTPQEDMRRRAAGLRLGAARARSEGRLKRADQMEKSADTWNRKAAQLDRRGSAPFPEMDAPGPGSAGLEKVGASAPGRFVPPPVRP